MNKYRALKTRIDGITFDSQLEAKRYAQLRLLERGGAISCLQYQVPYTLIAKSKYGREIKYVADFVYQENGKEVVEDTKSKATKTPLYRLKKRLMAEKYGIEIREIYG